MDPRELAQEVLLGPVFDALPVGVVVLDPAGLVRVFNKHEETLANRRRERVIGRPFFEEIAPCMNVRELAGEFFDKGRTGSNRGLGLTFVRMVARAHGGDVSVEDNLPRGAVFSMSLHAA
jgi:photoactive yellow protein